MTKRIGRLLGFLLLVGLFSMQGGIASAQTNTSTFTLEPGGKATVTFEAFCTDFGKKFPLSIQAPNALATDKVRSALVHIQSNNLGADPAQAIEAQYAIWQLQGATDSPAGADQAKAVVTAANNPAPAVQGTSVVDAIKANQVKVTINSWQPIGEKVQIGTQTDHFYGRGTLTIENTSQQALNLSMPVGSLFPPTTAGEQTMAAYATNVQVSNPQPVQQQQTAAQLPRTSGATHLLTLMLALVFLAAAGALRLARKML